MSPSVMTKSGYYLIFLFMNPTYTHSQSSSKPLSTKFDKAFHTKSLLGLMPSYSYKIKANSSPVAAESTYTYFNSPSSILTTSHTRIYTWSPLS